MPFFSPSAAQLCGSFGKKSQCFLEVKLVFKLKQSKGFSLANFPNPQVSTEVLILNAISRVEKLSGTFNPLFLPFLISTAHLRFSEDLASAPGGLVARKPTEAQHETLRTRLRAVKLRFLRACGVMTYLQKKI